MVCKKTDLKTENVADVGASDAEKTSSKRAIKASTKGLKYDVTRYQKKGARGAKCKQAQRCTEHVSVLIAASKDTVYSVTDELALFIKRYRDLNDTHRSFMSLKMSKEIGVSSNKSVTINFLFKKGYHL